MTRPEVGVDIHAYDDSASVFTEVGTRIQRWGAQSQTAADRVSSGFVKASSAITNLAGDALGANNKVANLVEGIGVMGIGGAWVAGIAAGVAIIATGYNLLTKEAHDARIETDKFIETQARAADDESGKTLRTNLDGTIIKIKELKEELKGSGQDATGWARNFLGYLTGGTGGLASTVLGNIVSKTKELETANKAAMQATALPDLEVTGKGPKELAADAKRAKDDWLEQQMARNRIGKDAPNVVGGRDLQLQRSDHGQVNEGALIGGVIDNRIKPLSDEAMRFDVAFKDAIAPLKDFNEEALTGSQILATLGGEVAGGVTTGFVAMFDAIGRGGKVFEGLKKAALKPVADKLRGYGEAAIFEGAIKVKEGLWPPNPLAIASGLGQIAAGGAAVAAAGRISGGGGGSGGGGATGGGAGSADSFSQGQKDYADRDRGTLQVVWPDDAFADPSNPRFQEKMAETYARAMERGVSRIQFIPRRG